MRDPVLHGLFRFHDYVAQSSPTSVGKGDGANGKLSNDLS